MKVGDLVERLDAAVGEPGSYGIFMGLRTYKNRAGGQDYICAEVYWCDGTVGTVQSDMIKVMI